MKTIHVKRDYLRTITIAALIAAMIIPAGVFDPRVTATSAADSEIIISFESFAKAHRQSDAHQRKAAFKPWGESERSPGRLF